MLQSLDQEYDLQPMPRLYHVVGQELQPVARKRLATEDQLQQWIATNPQLIGLDVLVLGREVTTESGGRIDILGLDRDGNLVIVECKRDRTPRDVIAQILDYASWVASLSTRQVHEIAQSKLGQRLDLAFEKRFQVAVPESLNNSHSLVIVAGEFDAPSRRIVEYLAEVHDIAINTAFFTTFEHNGEVLLATDWLLDQEEVTERAESKAKAPWSGLWYVNVGEGESRAWEDMRRYGFLSAGGGRYYSDFLGKLTPGSQVLAYQKGYGYVGYGIVTAPSVPVREFFVDGKPVLSLPLQQPRLNHDAGDPESCEYLVAVKWRKTVPLNEAKTFPGVFANQNIVCKLRDVATIEFLRSTFQIDSELRPLAVSGSPAPVDAQVLKVPGSEGIAGSPA